MKNQFFNCYIRGKDYVVFSFRDGDTGLNEIEIYNPKLNEYIKDTKNGHNLSNVLDELFRKLNERN